ncbi:MAG: LysR family transcriptional regulator, partial [Gammaproteobacteria bacterium]|nr:LysR family transcriptional regulator [Gammaproteobacteria bacterium]
MFRATIRQLQVFESVARHKSFTRAAEELFVTQSTVSIQLKQLAESLDVALIEQVGKKIYLTRAGETLLTQCQKLSSLLRETEQAMADYQSKTQGSLLLSGTITTQFFLPRVLAAFNKLYPDVDIQFQVTSRPQQTARLQKNLDDLYIIGHVAENMDIKVIPFVENPLIIVASAEHHLAQQKNIALKTVAREPFLVREPGSTTIKDIQLFCSEQKISFNQKMILGGNEAIKQGVIGGLGIAILSRFTSILELDSGLLVELDVQGFPIQRQWYIGYPSGKKLSLAAKAFLDFIRNQGRSIAQSCLDSRLTQAQAPAILSSM